MSRDDFFTKIKEGYFGGNIMHLREIEKVYGSGFLKYLANFEYLFQDLDLSEADLQEIFSEVELEKRNELIRLKLSDNNYKIFLERLSKI